MDDALIAQAGEFILGTLPADEHRAFAARVAGDPAAAEAVARWRARLAPLADAPAVPPPAHVWPLIEARLGAPATRAANDNRVAPAWRSAAIAASLVALVATGLNLRPDPVAPAPPVAKPTLQPSYVAAVTREGAEPALLVTLDPSTGRAVIRAIGLTPPEKKSLELWYIGGGRDPESLGVVTGDTRMEKILGQAMAKHDRFDASMFAISVEPEGGSPTGQATGPIVYSGKVMPVSGT